MSRVIEWEIERVWTSSMNTLVTGLGTAAVHKRNDGVKNVWTSDKSWEPVWMLLKTVRNFQIKPFFPRTVHLSTYKVIVGHCETIKAFTASKIMFHRSMRKHPRICGTTKNVIITTFNWNKIHVKLCYKFLQSVINLWWTYRPPSKYIYIFIFLPG